MDVRGLITVLFILGALYLVLSPVVATPIYKGMLFAPDKFPLGQYDLESLNDCRKSEHVFATSNGSKLHAWYFQLPHADKVVLLSHGNAGNLTTRPMLTRALLACGLSVFLYDYRGYGKSEGEPDLPGICDDGRAAYDYLIKDLKIPAARIVLYGESLGAAVTCQLMKSAACAGVILQSGFSSLRQAGLEQLPYLHCYPNFLFPRPNFDNTVILKQPHPPLLLVHGEQDSVLPISHGEELFKQALGPKTFLRIPEGGHSNVSESVLFGPAIKEFVSSLPSR